MILRNSNFAATVSLLMASSPSFADEQDVLSLANRIVNEFPAVHQYIDTLDSNKINQICDDLVGPQVNSEISEEEELRVLLSLVANITSESENLCVIRELHSMIGFSDLRPTEK